MSLGALKIVAGDHSLYEVDPPERTYLPRAIILHEAYNNNTLENDIALIELIGPITYSSAISPICLPTSSPADKETCTITGMPVPSIS